MIGVRLRVLFAWLEISADSHENRAPTLSRGIIDLDSACLHLRHRDRFRKNRGLDISCGCFGTQQNWLCLRISHSISLADLSSLALTSRARTRRRNLHEKSMYKIQRSFAICPRRTGSEEHKRLTVRPKKGEI